ncbi:hypothetical protein QX204_12490 [Nocardia sp. PE-7]|uniref:hypothetical protein n=1 Tax=Nocardia sp. PE-7 TaxID=3058426 RepID=UPI00265B473C|nr:hypothetical protein [Nocardia sp. PE-7]WKG12226.1 hypothetical protein QX204_12490 [Nocardia sp. PE-7]
MQFSTSPQQPNQQTTNGSETASGAANSSPDDRLVVRLQDPGLRRLCTRAAGLSLQAQWRLEAVAEALRNTEVVIAPRA